MITEIESDPRIAGQVMRYHTWPTHRVQSVGEHTWQVMRIMLTIDQGICSTRLLTYVMLHDVGEMAGDVPWPGKANDPVLKARMDAAEERIRRRMTERWGQPKLPELSHTERVFAKVCEYLEMWEFGLQERNMGNRYGTIVAQRMLLRAAQLTLDLPMELKESIDRYVTRRMHQESETEDINVHDPRHTSHGFDPSDETIQTVEKT